MQMSERRSQGTPEGSWTLPGCCLTGFGARTTFGDWRGKGISEGLETGQDLFKYMVQRKVNLSDS